MIIANVSGDGGKTSIERLQITGLIEYRDFPDHRTYYATGHRWIKSKQHWSSNTLRHSFRSYAIIEP